MARRCADKDSVKLFTTGMHEYGLPMVRSVEAFPYSFLLLLYLESSSWFRRMRLERLGSTHMLPF